MKNGFSDRFPIRSNVSNGKQLFIQLKTTEWRRYALPSTHLCTVLPKDGTSCEF